MRARMIGLACSGALGAAFLATGLGACAGYANYPAPTSAPATRDPNNLHPMAVSIEALRHVVTRHPPGPAGTTFGVNPPAGLTPERATELVRELGPQAVLAADAAPGTPTYHVGRIWIRSGTAKVDVYRPVIEASLDAAGQYRTQPITLWMEGGLRPWRVEGEQRWSVGAFPTPALWQPVIERTPAPPPVEPVYEPVEQDSGAFEQIRGEPVGGQQGEAPSTIRRDWTPESIAAEEAAARRGEQTPPASAGPSPAPSPAPRPASTSSGGSVIVESVP
ncbi:MAG: hypothetical protein AAF995_05450 [Planctomycetota bacterium]